jgi:adenylosuccinate lyase
MNEHKSIPEPFGASSELTAVSPLLAISPLDGRYAAQASELRRHFSEFALMRSRFRVEVEWLIMVLSRLRLPGAPELSAGQIELLRSWEENFDLADAIEIKRCEIQTRHDVKAVEYYLRQRLAETGHDKLVPFVHLCCTSEDINNISHAIMLRGGLTEEWLPTLDRLLAGLTALARPTLGLAMMSRTHGQPASPTTFGKEMSVFIARLRRQRASLKAQRFLGKFSGAVGNYNAHVSAYPGLNWPEIAREFLAIFDLELNPATTQIEPHDFMAEIFQLVTRVNSIIIDLDRDMWSYISVGYLKQKLYVGEVGSSTMPHKINPIDFENSEANAGVSTALLQHLAVKLPVSRLQRDLSDSSAIRTVGTAIGHSLLALKGCVAGLDKVEVDGAEMRRDLQRNWAVIGEAIQTIMRKQGVQDAYERIKAATQNHVLDAELLRTIVEQAGIAEPDRNYLLSLTPENFVGLAREIGEAVVGQEN